MSEIRDAVRDRYADAAKQLSVAGCCGESASASCCGDDAGSSECGTGYTAEQLAEVGLGSGVSLGCGNPTLLAELRPGEAVLDLGSGAGLDVLLSARRVAPNGHAYGVDMTGAMLELARGNQERAGIGNATFLEGTLERLPLDDASVDVVISNCVINLAEDKGVVLGEAFRVLRSGGRFAVADMVELEPLAPETKLAADAWAGCVSGSIPVAEYRRLLEGAGFRDVDIEVHDVQEVEGQGRIGSAYVRAQKP